MTLTAIDPDAAVVRGLPRPRQDGRPVPYITQRNAWSEVQWRAIHWYTRDGRPGRGAECVAGYLCQGCGLSCPAGDLFVVVNRGELDYPSPTTKEGGPMHRECAAQAYGACPYLRTHQNPLTLPVLVQVARADLEIFTSTMSARDLRLPVAYRITGTWTEVAL